MQDAWNETDRDFVAYWQGRLKSAMDEYGHPAARPVREIDRWFNSIVRGDQAPSDAPPEKWDQYSQDTPSYVQKALHGGAQGEGHEPPQQGQDTGAEGEPYQYGQDLVEAMHVCAAEGNLHWYLYIQAEAGVYASQYEGQAPDWKVEKAVCDAITERFPRVYMHKMRRFAK